MRYSLFIIFALTLVVNIASATAQPHPGAMSLDAQGRAEMLAMQGRFEDSVKAYMKLVEEPNASSSLVRGLVKASAGGGFLKPTRAFLETRLQSSPSPILFGIGLSFYYEGNFDAAEDRLRRSIREDSKNSLALNALGATLARKGRFDEGETLVRRAMEIDPSDILYYNNLLGLLNERGQGERFRQEYQESLENGRKEKAALYGRALARSLRQDGFRSYEAGDIEGTIEAFMKIAEINTATGNTPGRVQALFSLGVLYEETGDVEKAQSYYDEVLRINPEHIQAREKSKVGQGGALEVR
ncbi:MAG: tetratricopeptide repeat protein [Candidatus Nitrohelix vancouverensis]|uniref:Tetratricopeptide repeat protein n=1 Tax=Candidatus Nitrohelix vancouverensis TaxID=2705534 RepID=A0A7T0C457_9BACT|nr:MAG: tetratricopeptide repeat protein [Candidatus Nitrohelix vancouverensis]